MGHDRRTLVQRVGVQGDALHESGDVTEMVAASGGGQLQDAYAGDPRTAGLPAGRQRGVSAFYYSAAAGRAFEDALLSGRRALGAETSEFSALVPDGECVGGSVGGEGTIAGS